MSKKCDNCARKTEQFFLENEILTIPGLAKVREQSTEIILNQIGPWKIDVTTEDITNEDGTVTTVTTPHSLYM